MSSPTSLAHRLAIVAMAALLPVVLVACESGGSAKDTQEPASRTPWDTALDAIDADGTFSKEVALDLFAMAFGDMPGVETPARGGATSRSGTLALHAVLAHEDELTPAQRDRIARVRAIPRDGATVLISTQGRRSLLRAQARQLRQDIKARLGTDVPGVLGLIFEPKDAIDPKSGSVMAGWADARFAGGKYTGCYLHIMPATFAKGSNPVTTVAHEMIHCFQAGLQPDENAWRNASDWMLEGSAEWGSASLVGPDKLEADLWPSYIGEPGTPLFKRTYDAIGFFAHLEETGHSPWAAFAKMWATRGNAAQFAVVGGTAADVLDSWASSLTRESDFGTAWDTTGPGITDDIAPTPALKVGVGPTTVAAAAYTGKIYTLVATTDFVDISVAGHARLADGNLDETSLASRSYCLNAGGCNCPDAATTDHTPKLNPTGALLALSGGPGGASGTVTGRDLDCTGTGASWHLDSPSHYSGGDSHTIVDAYTCTNLRGPWQATLHVTHAPATPSDPPLDRTVKFSWTFDRDGSAVPKIGPYEDTVFGTSHQIVYYPHIQLNEKSGTIAVLGLEGSEDGSPKLDVAYQLDRIGTPIAVKQGKPAKC